MSLYLFLIFFNAYFYTYEWKLEEISGKLFYNPGTSAETDLVISVNFLDIQD